MKRQKLSNEEQRIIDDFRDIIRYGRRLNKDYAEWLIFIIKEICLDANIYFTKEFIKKIKVFNLEVSKKYNLLGK